MKRPFEAVSVRYVHDARAGEFLNVGVVLLCATGRFAGARFQTQGGRITAAFPGADLVVLRRLARAFEVRCAEWTSQANGQQDLLATTDLGGLLRSVVHPDDSSIQFSPVITGITGDPERTLLELFRIYAGAAISGEERGARDDADVWRGFSSRLDSTLVKRLQPHVLRARHYELSFDNAWRNGTWNVAQPLSLDMLEPRNIRDKATNWTGKLLTARPSEQDTKVYLLIGMPSKESPAEIREAANDALAILEGTAGREAEVLTEEQGEKLAKKIAADLAVHPS